MALTMAEVRQMVEEIGYRYFLDPQTDALFFRLHGENGEYEFVISLELEGQFLQFRSVRLQRCPADHQHLLTVLKVLGGLNYRVRLLKFAWDASDGEIVAYADVWLMDGTLTQAQFVRTMQNFLQSMDGGFGRIKQALETGVDPGEGPAEI